MSELAYFRFRSHNMLTIEEDLHKDEIIGLTEVLDAKGIDVIPKYQRSYFR